MYQYILQHLQDCCVDLSQATCQTDNGSEFIGSWQAKHDSIFTQSVQAIPGLQHRTIPPGAHRFQADVETVHNLVEIEMFEIEKFSSRKNFLKKFTTYQLWFNLDRKNRGKENKTPWQLAKEKRPDLTEEALLLPPVDLDALLNNKVALSPLGGYDVYSAPLTYIDKTAENLIFLKGQ